MNFLVRLWSYRTPLRRLLGRRAVIWLIMGSAAGIVVAGVEFLISLMISQILQVIGAIQAPVSSFWSPGASLTTFGVTLFILGIVRGTGFFLISQSGMVAQESIMLRLRVLAYQETFGRERGFISLSQLSTRVTDIFPKATLFCLGLANFLPAVLQLIVISALLAYKSVLLTMIGISCIGLIGWPIHAANARVRRIAADFPQLVELINSRMNRMCRNWFFLRAVRKMDTELQNLVNSATHLADSITYAYKLGNASAVLPQSLGILIVLGLIVTQQKLHPVEAMSFLSFLYLYFRFIQVLGQLATTYSAMSSNFHHFVLGMKFVGELDAGAFPEAMKAIERGSAVRRTAPDPIVASAADIIPAPAIEIEDVSFRYRSDLPWSVQNFSLQVPAGGRTALMGPSGSGKSTILALCMGVLRPDSGKILIGGMEPARFFEQYSERLGYVGAEPYLIEGTVRDNLTYGLHRSCSDKELLATLEKVHLKRWADQVARPLDHRLSEQGEGLSTGQKQRLMLARALLRQPCVLILDEMTANLDTEAEREMKELVSQVQNCTVLTVTHRIDFVQGNHDLHRLSAPAQP